MNHYIVPFSQVRVNLDVCDVIISEKAKYPLIKKPAHIILKLHSWIEGAKTDGLANMRKIPGYHDEPLQGKRKGQRSIRLNKAYRAIYVTIPNPFRK